MTEIHLNDEHREFIDEQVKAGIYKDADEVIRAGLSLLESEQGRIANLRRDIDAADRQIAEGNIIEVRDAGAYAQSVIERGRALLNRKS